MFLQNREKDNESLSDSRSVMSHVWVKVGQPENERLVYSGVGCNHGVKPDYNLTCVFVHCRICTE